MNVPKIIIPSLGLFVLLIFPSGAVSDVKSRVEIKNKSRDLDKVQEELNRKKAEQEQLSREASELSKSLQTSEVKLKGIESTLVHTKQKNLEVELNLAQTKNKLDRVSKQIRDTHSAVKTAFGTHYVMASVAGVSAPSSVMTRQLYLSNIQKLDRMKENRENQRQSFDELTGTYQIIQREVQNQESTLNQIRMNKQNQERLLQKKKTRQQILEDELKDLQRTAEELASLIDILRSRAQKEAVEEKRIRLEQQVSGHSPIQRSTLIWPVKGSVIKKFGRQKHSELATTYISNGITIRTPPLAMVQCVSDGQVLYAGNFMSYGRMVVVEHPGDWYSVYGQLLKWSVEKGQAVKKGDFIGQGGVTDTNQSDIYFELRFYGKPVDPIPWLALD